jgi:poly(A) polymerase/tRNA nucleotidyltransferase (CCA-adding enzyme)
VLPEAGDVTIAGDAGIAALRRLVAAGAPADPLLRLAALLPPDEPAQGTGLAIRLKFAGAEGDALAELLGEPDRISMPAIDTAAPRLDPRLDGPPLRRFLAGREGASTMEVQRAAWLAQARDGRDRGALRDRIAAAEWPRFPLRGRDALDHGAAPGPWVGRVLAEVRAWWLEGGCTASREACLAEMTRRLAAGPGAEPAGGGGNAAGGGAEAGGGTALGG